MHCLLAAPLLIGCPMDQLDSFTLNLITNSEVIQVNQDPLGIPASLIKKENNFQIWKKPLSDGSYAVGVFHVYPLDHIPQQYFRWGDEKSLTLSLDSKDFQMEGKIEARDLWRQENIGIWQGEKVLHIPHHGVYLFKISPL
jgi:alpha-galactosidase